MQTGADFFGVAFVVELEEAGENFTAGGYADSIPDALVCFVETVAQVEVLPTAGSGRQRCLF
jgi:hypothetical protein